MSNKNKTNNFAMNNTTSNFDTNWDIDKYRDEHECEEHWQLRKAFMEKWKNNFPEDRLICLARVYTNIEFMGCRYPAPVMQQIAQLSFEGGQKYKDKKKTKLQRTFVSASTAAEDRARGIKRVGGEIVTDDKPKSSRIAFVAQGEMPDNVEEKNISDEEGMKFLGRGTCNSSLTPGSPVANTARFSASMGFAMDNSMAQLQSRYEQRVLALTGTSTGPFSNTQVKTIPEQSFTALTPMLVNTGTRVPFIHFPFPPPMAPQTFPPEFAVTCQAGPLNWTENPFAHTWQVQNHCTQSKYSQQAQIHYNNPPAPSPTEFQRTVQLANHQALNAARKKLQAETGMSRPGPSQPPTRTLEEPTSPSFAARTRTLGNSSARELIHLPLPMVSEAIPPQLPVTRQTNFTEHTFPNACQVPNHNGQGKCTPQTQSHCNDPSGPSATVGCKRPNNRQRRQARKAAKEKANASINLSRTSQLPTAKGLAQQTGTKKPDRKAKRALIKVSKLHGQPKRPRLDQPKSDAQTSSTQASRTALNVAVTCGRTGIITKDVADQVLAAIQQQILLEAFSPNQDTPGPTFTTKPVFAGGVLKLWCENDHILAWLRKTVFSLSFPNTLLVIKSQSKLHKRVRCGLVIPDGQGVFKEPKHIRSVLSYQNTWVDIKRWVLRKAINQGTAWFVVFGVPEAHIPIIMKAERRLAFGVGSVYVKFRDRKGKFVEVPTGWDRAKQCISRGPVTQAEVTASPTNIASGAKIAAAESTANESIILSSDEESESLKNDASDEETETKSKVQTEDQDQDTSSEKKNSDHADDYIKEMSSMKCLDVRLFREDMFQSSFGPLVLLIRPWARKLWNIQTSCQVCGLTLTNGYENKVYSLCINQKLLAQATGDSKVEARNATEIIAWERLRREVISVLIKEQFIAQGDARISVSDVSGRKRPDVFGTPVENTVAMKMMKMMGWQGGGLGVDAQGISEPIKPNLQMVNRAGLGSAQNIRLLRRAATDLMQRYIASDTFDLDLVFTSDFSKEERAALHQIAQRNKLASRSYGEGDDRFLVVKKKLNPFSLVCAIIEKGGVSPKYQVFIPESLGQYNRR